MFEDLSVLSKEIINGQPTINIGTIGHVAHGKTTIVRSLSGENTVKFNAEKQRNITIKLGYANAKIFKCTNVECPRPGCYASYPSTKDKQYKCKRGNCGFEMELIRHVSFVDCPGHEVLMGTMLNGASVMDSAILLVAANEKCPQPQTAEHLAAVEIAKLKDIIILQNKIDLVSKSAAEENYKQIQNFTKGTIADNCPVIPTSAQMGYNIDILCEYIEKYLPIPDRNFDGEFRMNIIRSFNINKAGCSIENLKGGVAGGTIIRGIIHPGEIVEIRPGIIEKVGDRFECRPIKTKITELFSGKNKLDIAVSGGLIGAGTCIDPTLTRGDRLVGHVMGKVNTLPDVYSKLQFGFFLLRRVLGSSDGLKVSKMKPGEFLILNIGSLASQVKVKSVESGVAIVELNRPACVDIGDKIAISRKMEGKWRLIGWGEIIKGKKVKMLS